MIRQSSILLVALATAACDRSAAPTPSATDAASASPPPVVASVAPKNSPESPSFVRAPARASGPIVVRGYPHAIRNGMNDAATHVGFSKDGSLFGYCGIFGGGDPVLTCTLRDRAGRVSGREGKEAQAFVRDNGLVEIKGPEAAPLDAKPPPISGTWSFADITLDVARIEAVERKDADLTPAFVRVGGAVSGEAPVHPLSLSNNPVPAAPPHFAVMNGMALSPDGSEIGMVAHFFACEYCDSFVIERMPLGKLAALVYNDSGFRHHKKGEFAASAALFEKAVAADPQAKLPPYNLACAWARTGEPRAEDALARAIERDPTAKAKAQKDPDFDSVRTAPWFTVLVK
jgi:hypothetical protein